jgi:hypothetical protein
LLTGCVERKMQIRPDPPDAVVFIDGRRSEGSPDGETFIWYGTRTVTVVSEGHRPVTEQVTLAPPVYVVPPLDIVCELFLPWTLEDVHPVSIRLDPFEEEDVEAFLERAETYRVMD